MLALTLVGAGAPASGDHTAVPETFTATAQVAEPPAVSRRRSRSVEPYVIDYDRDAIRAGLKHGGYSGFLTALRAAPAIGSVTLGDQRFTVRWATQEATASGRKSSSSPTSHWPS